jgi:hypothetical protein
MLSSAGLRRAFVHRIASAYVQYRSRLDTVVCAHFAYAKRAESTLEWIAQASHRMMQPLFERFPDSALAGIDDAQFGSAKAGVAAARHGILEDADLATDGPGGIGTKLKQPSAVCAKCHIPHDFAEVGAKCDHQGARGEYCRGLIEAALSIGDWIKCPSCLASGRQKQKRCGPCGGPGWIYVRDLQWFK